KISQRMFDEFARNLEREMAGGGEAPEPEEPADAAAADEPQAEAPSEPSEPRAQAAPERRSRPAPAAAEPEALDPFGMFVAPVLKRALPIVGSALIGLGYGYLLGRLRELR